MPWALARDMDRSASTAQCAGGQCITHMFPCHTSEKSRTGPFDARCIAVFPFALHAGPSACNKSASIFVTMILISSSDLAQQLYCRVPLRGVPHVRKKAFGASFDEARPPCWDCCEERIDELWEARMESSCSGKRACGRGGDVRWRAG